MNFSSTDEDLINSLDINKEEVERQYKLLVKGTAFPELVSSAQINDGIIFLDNNQKENYNRIFESKKSAYYFIRFIPASGAATRMFSFLFEWLKNQKDTQESDTFFQNIEKFAFYTVLKKQFSRKELLEYILFEDGLNYSFLPKGLVHFHKGNAVNYTAVESQIIESTYYSQDKKGRGQTHFTISENHQLEFDKQIKNYLSENTISFSSQSNSTNTISIDENKEVVRDSNGDIQFRAGGHGSLLQNLNELNEDIIFIRNIDNVVSPQSNQEYISVHQMMGGLMIETIECLFTIQKKIISNTLPNEKEIDFLRKYFHYDNKVEIDSIKSFIFRPIRICGMVKNQGEPGGGPFWIREESGKSSLQIIESSQVNLKDSKQVEIFRNGTHFNPVDLCCCIKNYCGEKYDLNLFRNEEFSFLANKNVNGQNITVLEHPGLWNGSMHHWLTIFIELPIEVFNPVKTVNDLLRPAHQK